ncbi:hypothetical protein QM042_02095 [Escherichia coli]|uniref:hypothetical protein n=1 Tax=Escherichia coli TaxID=562 RepID=UPI0039862AC1
MKRQIIQTAAGHAYKQHFLARELRKSLKVRMTRLATGATTQMKLTPVIAALDMVADMQKTYSVPAALDNVKYEARGTVQPV